jgi:hypothetical protein
MKNKLLISTIVSLIIVIIVLFVIIFTKKCKNICGENYKKMEDFILNILKTNFKERYSRDKPIQNIDKLSANFLKQARCYNSAVFQICKDNSMEYVYDNINFKNLEKVLSFTDDEKYKELSQRCLYDKQLYCIKEIYKINYNIDNIIDFVIKNIEFGTCDVVGGECELSFEEEDMIDNYEEKQPKEPEPFQKFTQVKMGSGVIPYSYSTYDDSNTIKSDVALNYFYPPIEKNGSQIIYYLGNINSETNVSLKTIEVNSLMYIRNVYSFYSIIIRYPDTTFVEIRKDFTKSWLSERILFDMSENKINNIFDVEEIIGSTNSQVDNKCEIFLYLYGHLDEAIPNGGIRLNNTEIKLFIK